MIFFYFFIIRKPVAWNYWQALDIPGWGLIESNIQDKQIFQASLKYFVLSQYTRHIRPGMFILTCQDQFSSNFSAAFDNSTSTLVLICVNQDQNEIDFSFQSSNFFLFLGVHKRWTTSFVPSSNVLHRLYEDVEIRDHRSFAFPLPPQSITTFSISAINK